MIRTKGLGNVPLSFGEIAVILVVALLIFGPSKLPKIGRAAGETIQEFKKGMKQVVDDDHEQKKTDAP